MSAMSKVNKFANLLKIIHISSFMGGALSYVFNDVFMIFIIDLNFTLRLSEI